MHISYVPDREYDWRNGDWPTYYMQSDARIADDPADRRSQGGYTGGFLHQAVTTAESRKGHRVATSTDQAEAEHAESACKQVKYRRNFLSFLDVSMHHPTVLQMENYSTCLRTGAPIRKWSPASKHHDTIEKYIGECVERGIIRVQHIPGRLSESPQSGDGFRVDALTKALSADLTAFYYQELHGPLLLTQPMGGGKSKAKPDESQLTTSSENSIPGNTPLPGTPG